MPNIIKWLFRKQIKATAEDLDRKIMETASVCHLRLVDPPTVKRDDFADKFDKVIERTEGGHDSQD